jgi:hypothetical protein
VIDYVGSRAELAAGVVRAIGVPAMRFGEDHLRAMVSRPAAAIVRRLVSEERDDPTLLAVAAPFTARQLELLT